MILSFLIFVLSIVLAIYKKMNNLSEDILSTSWHKPRHFFARYLTKLGKTMHDHEIIGMEHLPEGPGIIVFYHGTFHIDYFFLLSRLYLQRGKLCILVADKALFYVPGLKPLLQVMAGIPGSKAECVEMLKKGCLLGIAPGGAREAFFSDENYNLLWGKRKGFAQLALEAKVPIIPMFTKNIKEVCRGYGRTRLSRWLYEKTRFISTPMYGYFPVKLCTYLGEPIPYDPNTTAEELAEKTKVAIENLRDQYQKVPGNILRAVSERFGKHNKD
nr:transmembrane protein 68-like [Pogona vitticeps]